MKIGDYVTVEAIMNQSTCHWVLLADLVYTENNGVKGGIVRAIADTKKEAMDKEIELGLLDTDIYLVNGTWNEDLVIGGVFVE